MIDINCPFTHQEYQKYKRGTHRYYDDKKIDDIYNRLIFMRDCVSYDYYNLVRAAEISKITGELKNAIIPEENTFKYEKSELIDYDSKKVHQLYLELKNAVYYNNDDYPGVILGIRGVVRQLELCKNLPLTIEEIESINKPSIKKWWRSRKWKIK